jgi:hypothetical protein
LAAGPDVVHEDNLELEPEGVEGVEGLSLLLGGQKRGGRRRRGRRAGRRRSWQPVQTSSMRIIWS